MRDAPARLLGPLFQPRAARDTKDPCPVFDGRGWHLFGSAGSVVVEEWELLHATAPRLDGPWTEQQPLRLEGLTSSRVAAPGVVVEDGVFHLFVQTDFLALGGTIEHCVSADGRTFTRSDTALRALADSEEAGLFDAHPAEAGGQRYLVYAAMGADLENLRWHWEDYAGRVRGPDVFLARSTSGSWDGPWERQGRILRQEDVPWHCPPGSPDYEWGLEGPQLLALPDGRVLLTAVCFLAALPRGRRQRVFLAVADSPLGPYRCATLPVHPPGEGWDCGENGHACVVTDGPHVVCLYQARGTPGPLDQGEARWRYGIATWPQDAFRLLLEDRG